MVLVRALLPEGQRVYLRAKGVTTLPLFLLNQELASHGLTVQATKGRDRRQFVACIDEQGRVEQYGVFELQRVEGAIG